MYADIWLGQEAPAKPSMEVMLAGAPEAPEEAGPCAKGVPTLLHGLGGCE